jgi:hypothetical protein
VKIDRGGAERVIGATIPFLLKPATKVVVFR